MAKRAMKGGFLFDTTLGQFLFTIFLLMLVVGGIVLGLYFGGVGIFSRSGSSAPSPPKLGPGGTESSVSLALLDATLKDINTAVVHYTATGTCYDSECSVVLRLIKDGQTLMSQTSPLTGTSVTFNLSSPVDPIKNSLDVTAFISSNGESITPDQNIHVSGTAYAGKANVVVP